MSDIRANILKPIKRSIANAVQIFYKDGTKSKKVEVEYPIGHRRRRDEGIPLLIEKFKRNLARKLARKISPKSAKFAQTGRV